MTPSNTIPAESVDGDRDWDEFIRDLKPEPEIDTTIFISAERQRDMVFLATVPYADKEGVASAIREAIRATVRTIKSYRPDLPLPAAAPPASPLVGPVKLIWEQLNETRWRAETRVGGYDILEFPKVGEDVLIVRLKGLEGSGDGGSWCRSVDEAKAAAQADFSARIRSCLTSHPDEGASR